MVTIENQWPGTDLIDRLTRIAADDRGRVQTKKGRLVALFLDFLNVSEQWLTVRWLRGSDSNRGPIG